MIVFLRGFTHGLAHEIKQFVRNERGVVALIFAVLFPIIVGLLFTAFQFDMYNRNITRVEMAQSSALHAGRNQASDAKKIEYTKIWVKLNTDFVSGLNASGATNNLAQIDEGKKYLYVRTTMDDLSPVVSWAVKSHFQSIMRIPLLDSSASGTCGKTYWEALRTCGKMSVSELRQISDKERVKADQMALINIGKAFFNSDKTGKTKSEITKLFGNALTGDSILLNYVDNHNVNENEGNDKIQTYVKTESGYKDRAAKALPFMKSDGVNSADYGAYTEDYTWDGEIDVAAHKALMANDNPDSNNQTAITHARFFFSDWMLEDMHDWDNVKKDFQDNCRTIRVSTTYDSDVVSSVRIYVNRGSSIANTGTHMYEYDVTINASNCAKDPSKLESLSTFQTSEVKNEHASTARPGFPNDLTDPLSGVQRWRSDGTYQTWYKGVYGSKDPDTYYFHDQDDYYRWYKGYLMSNEKDSGGNGKGANLTAERARAAANRIVYHIYDEHEWKP